ncbi:MAG: hypothetical protein K0S29_1193 [Gammaproteobacteria bacterium]|jgi:phage-related protein|nr:hypothetical protein [Gammaproteobacteria bacterium]
MKAIEFMGRTRKILNNLSYELSEEIYFKLAQLQVGITPKDIKYMSAIGLGAYELRVHSKTEYRVIYVAKYKNAIYVLHIFEKKTQQTSQKDIDLAKKRFKDLESAQRKAKQ